MRNAIVAALAGTLAGVAVQAAPRPVPAPAGAVDYRPTLRDLNTRVQVLEAQNWTLMAFYRCVHKKHVRVEDGVAPVTWRLTRGCVEVER
jgi:hypothetical protein